jgi:RecA-family ATPase
MSELAHITRNVTQQHQQEQRRTKLQEALSGIPPAKHQQEIAAAMGMDKERRLELKSKLDDLSTDELERMLSISSHRANP